MRRKHTPKRYLPGYLFHPVTYRQAHEETMVSPFRTKRKRLYKEFYKPNRRRLLDFVRYKKYRHIINAAKENLLARGGVSDARFQFYNHLRNAKGVHRYPTSYIDPIQRLARKRRPGPHYHAHYYDSWRDTSFPVDQDLGSYDWGGTGMFIPDSD